MATWQDFLREARRFWEVAQAVNAPGYHSQAVSNAVHAVIAANDALCLFQIGERAQGDSHAEAANMLKRACRGTAFEQQVTQRARQLTDVLQQKTPSQYYGKQAERFIRWIEDTLPQPDPGKSR